MGARIVEDAQDVAQIVFLKVAERLDEYDGQYKFFSWIYRIAVNESLNLLRRHGREEPLDEEIDLPDADSASPESKLNDAQASLDTGNLNAVRGKLSDFISQCSAQRGKRISPDAADLLISDAQYVSGAL